MSYLCIANLWSCYLAGNGGLFLLAGGLDALLRDKGLQHAGVSILGVPNS